MAIFRSLCILLALALGTSSLAQSETMSQAEIAKVNFLLGTISSLKDAQFVRNGASFSSAEAVAHLRYKWRAAGNRVLTARDFIREVASKSSVSGMSYTIRFSNGREVPAADFLQQQLAAYEKQH